MEWFERNRDRARRRRRYEAANDQLGGVALPDRRRDLSKRLVSEVWKTRLVLPIPQRDRSLLAVDTLFVDKSGPVKAFARDESLYRLN